jgi:hypothetical protein
MTRQAVMAVLLLAVAACSNPAASPIGTVPGVAATATAAPTSAVATAGPVATALATLAPTPEPPPIAITSVECLDGQTVRLTVHIQDDRGVVSYEVWSTWGGGGQTTRSFPTPYRKLVDETLEFTHALVDPEPGRIHQFGLAVTLAGVAEPILTYEIEPGNRCPGH